MNKLSRTINRRIARETRDTQEVFTGVYGQPRGLRRGIVTLGRCQQDVIAARSSDHDKNETVMVVCSGPSCAILPGPPSKAGPGPSSTSTLVLPGTPFTQPAEWMIVYSNFTASAHAADGTFLANIGGGLSGLGSAGRAFSDPSDNGKRCLLEGETVKVIDFFDETVLTYTTGTLYEPGHPMKVGNFLYWIEFNGDVGNPAPAKLQRSELDLTDVTTVDTASVDGGTEVINWGAWRGHIPQAHDFSNLYVRFRAEWTDTSFEIVLYRGAAHPIPTGIISQQGNPQTLPSREGRAGLPLTDTSSICLAGGVGEHVERTVQTWEDNAPSGGYSPFADSPVAVDLYADDDNVYLLTAAPGAMIRTYTKGGIHVQDISVETVTVKPVGLYRFTTPREVLTE